MAVFRIPVTKFIAASKQYANSAIDKVNTNGNIYLTLAEEAKLPKDLRDNLKKHRALAQENGVTVVAKAKKAYGGYVTAKAWAADKTPDGKLTLTEGTRYLPKDLQDNFRNYYNATKPR